MIEWSPNVFLLPLPLMRFQIKEWTDVNMKWNKSEYGNIKDIRIPPSRLWKPDILMYNRYIVLVKIFMSYSKFTNYKIVFV